MDKNIYIFIIGAVLVLITLSSILIMSDRSRPFVERRCDEVRQSPHQFQLLLSNGDFNREILVNGEPSKSIVFIFRERFPRYLPGKWISDWSDVDKLIFEQSGDVTATEGNLSIRLLGEKMTPIGVINDNCWTKLKTRFGNDLLFEKKIEN